MIIPVPHGLHSHPFPAWNAPVRNTNCCPIPARLGSQVWWPSLWSRTITTPSLTLTYRWAEQVIRLWDSTCCSFARRTCLKLVSSSWDFRGRTGEFANSGPWFHGSEFGDLHGNLRSRKSSIKSTGVPFFTNQDFMKWLGALKLCSCAKKTKIPSVGHVVDSSEILVGISTTKTCGFNQAYTEI